MIIFGDCWFVKFKYAHSIEFLITCFIFNQLLLELLKKRFLFYSIDLYSGAIPFGLSIYFKLSIYYLSYWKRTCRIKPYFIYWIASSRSKHSIEYVFMSLILFLSLFYLLMWSNWSWYLLLKLGVIGNQYFYSKLKSVC